MEDDPYGDVDAVMDRLNLDWEGPTKSIVEGSSYEIYTAKATNTFWPIWNKHKYVLKDYGVDVQEDDEEGEYLVCIAVNRNAIQAMKMEKNSSNVLPRPYNLSDEVLDILKESQIEAAGSMEKILKIQDFVLDASEMGMGKTFHALAVVKTFGWNFGVICPASVVSKWENTAWDYFGMEPEFVHSYQKMTRGNTPYLIKTTLGKGKKQVRSWKWDCIDNVFLIFDEIQYCGGQGTQNAEMLESALKNRYIKIIGASATVADSPLSLKVIGRALGLHKGHNWWNWCKDNGCREGYFGGLEFVKSKQKQRYYQIKLHNEIYPKKATRLLKKDLKEKLPDNILLAECIDVDFKPKQGYLKEALKHLEQIEEADWEKENPSPLTPIIRDRQRAELVKIPFLIEEAEEAYGQGMSVVIFANFKMTVEILTGQLKKYKPSIVVGGQSATVRDKQLSAFQNNSTQMLISNIDAGSEGIDLHDTDGNYPRYVLLCPMDKAKKMIQCLGRVDRQNKKSISTQKLIFAKNSREEQVFQNVCRKMNNIQLLNDGELEDALQFEL